MLIPMYVDMYTNRLNNSLFYTLLTTKDIYLTLVLFSKLEKTYATSAYS